MSRLDESPAPVQLVFYLIAGLVETCCATVASCLLYGDAGWWAHPLGWLVWVAAVLAGGRYADQVVEWLYRRYDR